MADLKLRVVVDTKSISDLPRIVQDANAKMEAQAKASADRITANEDAAQKDRIAMQRASISLEEGLRTKAQAEYERWWQKQLSIDDASEKQRIAMQRASIALEEKMERERAAAMEINSRNSLQQTQSQAAATLRVENQAAQAQAALVLDKFDRRIAVERTKHLQILENLKGNDAAQEAEIRRSNAVIARIQMDKANLPNTPFQQLLGGMQQGLGLQGGIAGLAGMAGAAIAANFAITRLGEAIHSTVENAMQMQTIHQIVEFSAGGAKDGAEAFSFLEKESMKLGISLKDTAPEFARMQAAAMGTTMAGQGVRDVFHSMSEAAVVLHLNTEQQTRAFYSLQEMISMGSVQTRQLRMLSLALPGAFNDAAKAMGVTTEEMMKMMAHGKVMTDEFLPKFAQVIDEKYGQAAVEASTNARQSIQKLNNAIFETSSMIGEVALAAYGELAKELIANKNALDAAADAQYRYWDALHQGLNDGGANQKNNAALAEGLRLAKEAKTLEDQKSAGPTSGQQEAIKQMNKDDAAAAKFGLELKKEYEKARIEATEDGRAKDLSLEQEKYKENLVKAGEYYVNQKLALDLHKADIARINKTWNEKDLAEQDKIDSKAEASNQKRDAHFLEEQKKQLAAEQTQKKERETAANKLQLAQTNSPIARLKIQQEQELKLITDFQARKDIIMLHEIEMKQAEKEADAKLYEAKAGYVNQYANSLSQMVGIIGGKSKEAFLIQQALALGQIAVQTSAAVVADNAVPLGAMMWKVPYDIALGVTQAAVVAGTAIKGFAGGTDYAPPGLAWVGERGPELVNFRGGEQVHTAGKSAAMVGGSNIDVGGININLSGTATQADANLVANTIDARLRGLAKDLKELSYRNITA